MAARKPRPGKKYFTASEANATLPLVRAIVRDIMELAKDFYERQERLARLRPGNGGDPGDASREELQHIQGQLERDQERLSEYIAELSGLGIELKQPLTGLVDFPCWMDGREVYLCWQYGEAEVAHWHELHAGFAGRQKLMADAHAE
jgi:hypothetical protein